MPVVEGVMQAVGLIIRLLALIDKSDRLKWGEGNWGSTVTRSKLCTNQKASDWSSVNGWDLFTPFNRETKGLPMNEITTQKRNGWETSSVNLTSQSIE